MLLWRLENSRELPSLSWRPRKADGIVKRPESNGVDSRPVQRLENQNCQVQEKMDVLDHVFRQS